MVKIQSSGAIQTFQHLGTHLPLTAVGEGGDFQQVIAASLNKQAGILPLCQYRRCSAKASIPFKRKTHQKSQIPRFCYSLESFHYKIHPKIFCYQNYIVLDCQQIKS